MGHLEVHPGPTRKKSIWRLRFWKTGPACRSGQYAGKGLEGDKSSGVHTSL
jgi:hypothetical protein